MRKFRRRSLLILAVLAAIGTVVFLIDRNSAKAAWENYAAAAKARGVKLSLKDEMLPPPVPDAENFAAAPIFAQFFGPNAKDAAASKLFDLPRLKRDPKTGEPPDLEAWRSLFVEKQWLAADATDSTPVAILRLLDERFGASWQQLREAAIRPQCRFPVNWEKGFGTKLPHFSALTNALKLCALRADANIAKADGPAAYEDLRLLLRLHWSLEKEPTLICWIVSTSMLSATIDCVRDGLAAHVWDDTTLLRLDGELARLHPLADYRWSMESERGLCNDFYAAMQTADNPSRNAMLATLGGGTGTALIPPILTKNWLYRNQLRGNQYVEELLARIDADSGRYIPTLPGRSLLNPAPSVLERLNYVFFYLVMPTYSLTEKTAPYSHTRVQCARTAIALERWRLVHGAYPDSLAALVPGLLPVVPHDVMDGQPLRYRRTEAGGYLLYSIGIDARDDGGTGPKPGKSPKDAPDWLWKP